MAATLAALSILFLRITPPVDDNKTEPIANDLSLCTWPAALRLVVGDDHLFNIRSFRDTDRDLGVETALGPTLKLSNVAWDESYRLPQLLVFGEK